MFRFSCSFDWRSLSQRFATIAEAPLLFFSPNRGRLECLGARAEESATPERRRDKSAGLLQFSRLLRESLPGATKEILCAARRRFGSAAFSGRHHNVSAPIPSRRLAIATTRRGQNEPCLRRDHRALDQSIPLP